jgi:hypothetical protein
VGFLLHGPPARLLLPKKDRVRRLQKSTIFIQIEEGDGGAIQIEEGDGGARGGGAEATDFFDVPRTYGPVYLTYESGLLTYHGFEFILPSSSRPFIDAKIILSS